MSVGCAEGSKQQSRREGTPFAKYSRELSLRVSSRRSLRIVSPPTCQSSTPVSSLPEHSPRTSSLRPRGVVLPRPAPLQGLTPTRAAPHPVNTSPRRERVPERRVRRVPPLEAQRSEARPGGHPGGGAGGGEMRAARRPGSPRLGHGPVGGALSGPPLRTRRPARPAPARWALDGRPAGQRLSRPRGAPASAKAPPGPATAPSSAGRPAQRRTARRAPPPPTPRDTHLGGSSRRDCCWDRCRRLRRRRPQRRRPHWRQPPRPFSSSRRRRRRPSLSCQWFRLRDHSRFPPSPF